MEQVVPRHTHTHRARERESKVEVSSIKLVHNCELTTACISVIRVLSLERMNDTNCKATWEKKLDLLRIGKRQNNREKPKNLIYRKSV